MSAISLYDEEWQLARARAAVRLFFRRSGLARAKFERDHFLYPAWKSVKEVCSELPVDDSKRANNLARLAGYRACIDELRQRTGYRNRFKKAHEQLPDLQAGWLEARRETPPLEHRLLAVWCETRLQRLRLGWRASLWLYMYAVEGLSMNEIGQIWGMCESGIQHDLSKSRGIINDVRPSQGSELPRMPTERKQTEEAMGEGTSSQERVREELRTAGGSLSSGSTVGSSACSSREASHPRGMGAESRLRIYEEEQEDQNGGSRASQLHCGTGEEGAGSSTISYSSRREEQCGTSDQSAQLVPAYAQIANRGNRGFIPFERYTSVVPPPDVAAEQADKLRTAMLGAVTEQDSAAIMKALVARATNTKKADLKAIALYAKIVGAL